MPVFPISASSAGPVLWDRILTFAQHLLSSSFHHHQSRRCRHSLSTSLVVVVVVVVNDDELSKVSDSYVYIFCRPLSHHRSVFAGFLLGLLHAIILAVSRSLSTTTCHQDRQFSLRRSRKHSVVAFDRASPKSPAVVSTAPSVPNPQHALRRCISLTATDVRELCSRSPVFSLAENVYYRLQCPLASSWSTNTR